jgi:hypothetical protein
MRYAALLVLVLSTNALAFKCRTPDGKLFFGDTPPANCERLEDTAASASASRDAGVTAATTKVENEIRANCAAEWPHDFVMQKDCVVRQAAAFSRLKPWVNSLPDDPKHPENIILGRCGLDWPGKAGGTDYVMFEDCVKRQGAALDQLRR